jgi:hypothetical protein
METVKHLRLEQKSGTDAAFMSSVPVRESAAEFRKLRFPLLKEGRLPL